MSEEVLILILRLIAISQKELEEMEQSYEIKFSYRTLYQRSE
jgi:hypothetical protein